MNNETNKLLLQELFAETLWIEWYMKNGILKTETIRELLQKCNLKLKSGKSIDDIRLAFGRGLKDTFGNTKLARKQIAKEIDKVCIIANWNFAIAKYKGAEK